MCCSIHSSYVHQPCNKDQLCTNTTGTQLPDCHYEGGKSVTSELKKRVAYLVLVVAIFFRQSFNSNAQIMYALLRAALLDG